MLNRIKGFAYDIVLYFVLFTIKNKNKSKKVLIIRVDEIGDYILWRKFIHPILNSYDLTNHEIHFLGNESWQSLFELEFKGTFTKLYWLKKNNFKKNLSYRYSFLKKIAKENYAIIINPTYSRAKRIDDTIVKAANATTNIGILRNNENYLPYEQNFDRQLYHKLYKVQEKYGFEFNRNKEFAEWVCKSSIPNLNLNFESNTLPQSHIALPENGYFIVFPGSRSSARIWDTENFIVVSNYLYQKYKLTAIVCGGQGDILYAERFIQAYSNPVINITAKTSLPELLSIIKNAACLLSVDTGSIHLAASVNCLALGIFNGSQYGRFSPYPKEISSKIISFYPKQVLEDINQNVLSKYELISTISYNDVSPNEVIDYLNSYPLQEGTS
jgi:ADP-heptose:LPS heptosyltransferase